MGETLDIGRRVELVPMDAHFHNISIGLYQQKKDRTASYRVHTYSTVDGFEERIDFLSRAMALVGELTRNDDGLLSSHCGAPHERAIRRLFLDCVKLDSASLPAPRALEINDRKSGLTIRVNSLSDGVYRVTAEGESDKTAKRIASIAGGLAKLGDLEWSEDASPERVSFTCGNDHSGLLGQLLVRAPNVRAVLREEQSAASRGVLAAPSQQE